MTIYEPEYLKRWTHPANYVGETWPNYYSAGIGQSRDSDALERSNFACMLEALGGESETVTVVRESHWAIGWVEWIAIDQDDGVALKIADSLKCKLGLYPILDEENFSELEQQDADQTWKNCFDWRERVVYIREHRSQFEPQTLAELLSCVRGDYFLGYASELLN